MTRTKKSGFPIRSGMTRRRGGNDRRGENDWPFAVPQAHYDMAQGDKVIDWSWIPACAGMTRREWNDNIQKH